MNRDRYSALKVGEEVWGVLWKRLRGVLGSNQVSRCTVLSIDDSPDRIPGLYIGFRPFNCTYSAELSAERVFLSEESAIRRAIELNTRMERMLSLQASYYAEGAKKLERRLYSMQVKSTRKKTKEARSRAKKRPAQ